MTKSIEELLKIVNERPSKNRKIKEDHRDVMDFINELNIESGTQAVPSLITLKERLKKLLSFKRLEDTLMILEKTHRDIIC